VSEEKEYGISSTPGGGSGSSSGMVHVESGENLGGSSGGPEQERSGDQPPDEGTNADVDLARGHAVLRAAISRGLIKGGGERGSGTVGARTITQAQVFAAAIGSVSVVLIALALFPFIFNLLIGQPFQYTNVPFPLCQPDIQYIHDDDCTPAPAGFKFKRGDYVPMLFGRCFHDPFTKTDELPYAVHRRLVSDQNGVTITIADTFATVHQGCYEQRRVEHAIPDITPPGNYHFEGFSEIHASWTTQNVLWRSETFEVSE
jgi:hypothetical protein